MSGPVVSPSTQEWQRRKLGPNLVRESRWLSVDLRFTTRWLAALMEPLFKAATELCNSLAAAALGADTLLSISTTEVDTEPQKDQQ